MALTTIAAVNAALPGQALAFSRPTSTFGTVSLWKANGFPTAGGNPSSGLAGDIPTDATTGGFPFVNPASGNTYLGRLSASYSGTTNTATLFLYDRLWHNSGIDATIATPQTINSVALTRPDALGASVEAWWETYATMGAGTPTVTLAYTDQSGNVETTGSSGALATAMSSGRTGQFNLAAGDTGVRSIQTWTASATFSSGTIGLVMRRQVAAAPIVRATTDTTLDALGVGLPRVYDDACLELLGVCSGIATYTGSFNLVQG